MAATKSTSTKKTTSKKKTESAAAKQKKINEAMRINKARMWSSVLFVVGIFVAFLTFIKGQSLWTGMHNVLWGLFGVSAVLVAPIIVYVAIMMALDKARSAVISKMLQGLVLMLLVSPAFEIVGCLVNHTAVYEGSNVTDVLTYLYNNGVNMHGGGAMSIIVGWTLTKLCGEVCALIIIALLILLFIMLITNVTPADVVRFIANRIKKAHEKAKEREEARAEELLERQRIEAEEKEKTEKEAKVKKDEEKRIDIAKFIKDDDDRKSEPEKEDEPVFPPFSGDPAPGQEEPIKESKPAKKSKREKTPADFIADDEPQKGEIPSDTVNPIYVDEDGQTTLLENDDTTKSTYQKPSIELLNYPKRAVTEEECRQEIQEKSETLVETLKSFGVSTRITEIHRGPSVTRYEIQPAAGVKVSKITGLVDDIALNLAASGVRIEAPIPGKAAVGIELANKIRDIVNIRELIDSDEFRSMKSKLAFPVGKNIEGKIVTVDIAKMPHMLIAGTTGSGKSVLTNSIIMSILFNASPDEVKLILVDPKQVEFPIYNGIPHLLIPVVTEAKKAAGALGWAVTEMMKRYNMFANSGVRDITEYNEYTKTQDNLNPLPKIVIVVDELADLMMAAPKEVEDSICRLAQLARAAGMHLVIATQSPRVDVITGLIKANIDSRIALRVSSQIDSSVILNTVGAEKLLGNGDLLIKCAGYDKPVRVQGGYVATEEIRRVVDYLKAQESSKYDDEIVADIEKHIPVTKADKAAQAAAESQSDSTNSEESMINRAIEEIVVNQQASTSFIQRRLKLGYARAARIMDEIEEMGIIGPSDGAKPREIRITREQWMERKATIGGAAVPVLEKPDDEDE